MNKLEFAKWSMNETEKKRAELVEKYREAEDKYIEAKDKLEGKELAFLRNNMLEFTSELRETKKDVKDWRREYVRLKNKGDIKITHHAIIQYLDRKKHFDIPKLKNDVIEKLFEEGKIESKEVKVEDSAISRYLKKEGLIDMEEIENYLLPEDLKRQIIEEESIGVDKTYTLKCGFRIITTGGRVVTVLPKKKGPIRFPKSTRKNGRRRKLKKMKL